MTGELSGDADKSPTFEELREALRLPLKITVRHDAIGRVIRKKEDENEKK